jgi:hypothetical protein
MDVAFRILLPLSIKTIIKGLLLKYNPTLLIVSKITDTLTILVMVFFLQKYQKKLIKTFNKWNIITKTIETEFSLGNKGTIRIIYRSD